MPYDNTNSGMIQKNKQKTEDKHPDIKGILNAGGTEYWVAGWSKKKKDTQEPYYQLKLTLKEDK